MFGIPILISILVFTGSFLFIVALMSTAKYIGEQRVFLRKLRAGEMVGAKESEENLSERLQTYFEKWMLSLGQWIRPKKESDLTRVEIDLLRAGYRSSNATIFISELRYYSH